VTDCVSRFNEPGTWYGSSVTNLNGYINRQPQVFNETYGVFQLDRDEAVIWIGCTPDRTNGDVRYFSFSKNVKSEGDYKVTKNLRNGALGDALNSNSLNVSSLDGTRFGGVALIVYSSLQSTTDRIVTAFKNAKTATGKKLQPSAINVDPWPVENLEMGCTKEKAFLVLFARVWYNNPDPSYPPALSYTAQVFQLFPYVHLTPTLPFNTGTEISPRINWIPDYSGAVQAVVDGGEGKAGDSLISLVSQMLFNIATLVPGIIGLPSAVYPVLLEDDGQKWLNEDRAGFFGTRDIVTFTFPTVTVNAANGDTLFVCGPNHNSPNWNTLGVPVHATAWSVGVYQQSNNKAAAWIQDTDITSDGNTWISNTDPNSVLWCEAIAADCGVYMGLPCQTANANFNGQLSIFYRVYVNPSTTVYPSLLSLLQPVVFVANV